MKYRSISEEHVSSCLKGHSKFLVLMSTDEWSDKTDDCSVVMRVVLDCMRNSLSSG